MSSAADPPRARGPALSILLTVHGRTQFLRSALASVDRQGVPSETREILVVGPFDDAGLARELSERGIEWIPSPERGLGAKVALAVRRSRAPLLLLLEDDDRFLPGKLTTVLARFQEDPHLGYLHNSFVPIDEAGEEIRTGFFREKARLRMDRKGVVEIPAGTPRRDLGSLTHLFPGYNTSSIAIRREILEPHLDLLARVDLVVDQFLLTAALGSAFGLRIDSARLTAIRMHGASASNPETAGGDRLQLLGRFSERNRESWGVLLELARRSRDPEVIRATQGAVAVEEAIRLLRGPGRSRAEISRQLLDLARSWDSFSVRTFQGVMPLAAGYLCSPAAARAIYRVATRLTE